MERAARLGIHLHSGGGKGNPGRRQVMFAVLHDAPYRIRMLAIGGAVGRLVQTMCPEIVGLGARRSQADDDGSEQARGGTYATRCKARMANARGCSTGVER